MAGLGMIFEETYLPAFIDLRKAPLYSRETGPVEVQWTAAATRTGARGQKYLAQLPGALPTFTNHHGPQALDEMLKQGVHLVCVATPDDRHFQAAKKSLEAGKHVLIEKPSVLKLEQLDVLVETARKNCVLAKVVYHKLADPDHKKLRTHYADGVLKHVNNGFCSLLEPKQISGQQFAEWIQGRNPGTYVAVHYIKLIDFSFGPSSCQPGWKLWRIGATGQRGLVGKPDGKTWDSCQLQVTYLHPDNREATFDIHTSWVNPDNFPGYVEQEVQFRFDNGIWNAHQRKRGVEMAVEDRSPHEIKNTPNHHYNGDFLEPWGARSRRGYGIEIIRKFFEEVAQVEFGGEKKDRETRLKAMSDLHYNDLSADRNTVAIVQALEALLEEHAGENPGCQVFVNDPLGGLVLRSPGGKPPRVLYSGTV
ncbi:MAG: Gfo/Idh/MocA family oxidoreductase [Gemmataceae bacterium]|nr:Gfo/Idh/MocA family oxidoreductase [Gemmataceae bacterium]